MVAYSFKLQFESDIIAGRKPHTIRAERNRHARPGEEIQLYTGMRTKHCRLIGRAICRDVEPITLDFGNDAIFIGSRHPIHVPKRLNEFARTDGFADWEAMRNFLKTTHGAISRWTGVLIRWEKFKPAGSK